MTDTTTENFNTWTWGMLVTAHQCIY